MADDRDGHSQGVDRAEGGRPAAFEGTWRSHQVLLSGTRENDEHRANPHAIGGLLLKPLRLRDFGRRGVEVVAPGASLHEPTREMAGTCWT